MPGQSSSLLRQAAGMIETFERPAHMLPGAQQSQHLLLEAVWLIHQNLRIHCRFILKGRML
jgi:hypothetical protein